MGVKKVLSRIAAIWTFIGKAGDAIDRGLAILARIEAALREFKAALERLEQHEKQWKEQEDARLTGTLPPFGP